MPGPTPTLSRCAPTTMTLSGSPSLRLGDHVRRLVRARPPVDLQPGRSPRWRPSRRRWPAPTAVSSVIDHRTGTVDAGDVDPDRPVRGEEEDRARHRAAAAPKNFVPRLHEVPCLQQRRSRPAASRRSPPPGTRWCCVAAVAGSRSRSAAHTGAVTSPDGDEYIGAEVAAEQRAGDTRDERASGAAGDDVQDRRRVVGEQVEVVLEVLPADVEARGRGPLGHVVRRRVVARRPREAVAAGEVGDVLQRATRAP